MKLRAGMCAINLPSMYFLLPQQKIDRPDANIRGASTTAPKSLFSGCCALNLPLTPSLLSRAKSKRSLIMTRWSLWVKPADLWSMGSHTACSSNKAVCSGPCTTKLQQVERCSISPGVVDLTRLAWYHKSEHRG